MSDKTVQDLVNKIRLEIPILFRVCESISMLDMIAGFGQLVTTNDYVRPEITDCIAIKSARHPVREKVSITSFSIFCICHLLKAFRCILKSSFRMISMLACRSGFK